MARGCEGEDDKQYLSASPDIKCWEGRHLTILAFDALAWLLYLTLPAMYMHVFFRMVPRYGLDDYKLKHIFVCFLDD